MRIRVAVAAGVLVGIPKGRGRKGVTEWEPKYLIPNIARIVFHLISFEEIQELSLEVSLFVVFLLPANITDGVISL